MLVAASLPRASRPAHRAVVHTPSALRASALRASALRASAFRAPAFRAFSQRTPPASVAELLESAPGAQEARDVTVNGYVRSVRHMKSQSFVSLSDGSSFAPLQAIVPADRSKGLTVGAAVRVRGSWVSSPGAGQSHELRAEDLDILGPSDAKTFPIQKKYQTPEYLRTLPHLRPRTPHNTVLLRLRSAAIASLTHFFASRSFTQTHPPVITSSDCEGAGEAFAVSPADQPAGPDGDGASELFFRSPKYLTVSAQLHLEALAQAVGHVWTLAPTFRAEKSDTARHLSEFYMLEAEMSFVDDLGAVMDLAEDMLRHLSSSLYDTPVAREVLSRSRQAGSDLEPADTVEQRWDGLMQGGWPRLTYTEAIDILAPKADMFAHRPTWGSALQTEHERYVAKHVGGGKPVFVTDYPRDIKAFYMRQGAASAGTADRAETSPGRCHGPTVDCFDLLVPDLCEIAGGSMREHRLQHLLDAMRLRGMAAPHPNKGTDSARQPVDACTGGDTLDWYVDLRRWGCPPHGGFGLGFDRLLSYLSGVQTIRDVVAFPRWFGRCDC